MREYFEQKSPTFSQKLYIFGKNNNADYIENNKLVWKIPNKQGSNQCAIRMNNIGLFEIGYINPQCDNFMNFISDQIFNKVEAKWLVEILSIVSKYKR